MAKRRPLQDAQLNQRIGFRIFKERQRRGLTALVLAKRAGVHENTVYRAEQGRGISVTALFRIGRALGTGIDSLLSFPPDVVVCTQEPVARTKKAARVVSETARNLFASLDFSPGHPASVAQRPEARKS